MAQIGDLAPQTRNRILIPGELLFLRSSCSLETMHVNTHHAGHKLAVSQRATFTFGKRLHTWSRALHSGCNLARFSRA